MKKVEQVQVQTCVGTVKGHSTMQAMGDSNLIKFNLAWPHQLVMHFCFPQSRSVMHLAFFTFLSPLSTSSRCQNFAEFTQKRQDRNIIDCLQDHTDYSKTIKLLIHLLLLPSQSHTSFLSAPINPSSLPNHSTRQLGRKTPMFLVRY